MKQKQKKRGRPKKEVMTPSRARAEKWKESIITHYLKGNTMDRVAQIMKEETGHKISTSTVSKYVAEAVETWKRNKETLLTNHVVTELEKINRVEAAAWEGWERSVKAMTSVRSKKTPLKHSENCGKSEISENPKKKTVKASKIAENPLNTVEVTDETKQSAGDPRFFATIQWCVEYRCKLLGNDAPIKIETNTTLNANVNQTTTLVRKVVFRTRETTGAPQTLPAPQNN